MTLAEMMILGDLMDNRKEQLSELSGKVQKSLDETKKSCNEEVILKSTKQNKCSINNRQNQIFVVELAYKCNTIKNGFVFFY